MLEISKVEVEETWHLPQLNILMYDKASTDLDPVQFGETLIVDVEGKWKKRKKLPAQLLEGQFGETLIVDIEAKTAFAIA